MKTLKLFLVLTLVAFLSSSFTFKTQQPAATSKVTKSKVTDIYIGTIDIEIPVEDDPNPLILTVNLYGILPYYGANTYTVTYAENVINNNQLPASGTVSGIGGSILTANVVVNGFSYYGPI